MTSLVPHLLPPPGGHWGICPYFKEPKEIVSAVHPGPILQPQGQEV